MMKTTCIGGLFFFVDGEDWGQYDINTMQQQM